MKPITVAIAIGALALAAPVQAQAQNAGSLASGGSGTILVGNYAKAIYVVDEETMAVRDTIAVAQGIPVGFVITPDRSRLYAIDATFEHVTIVDLVKGEATDHFMLSEGNRKVRIYGLNVDPKERFAILFVKTYTKQIDRFVVDPPRLLRYDLQKRAVTDTIPWPNGEEREGARILFSPDGSLMYFFSTDDILVFDTGTMKQVDRFQLAHALEEGMGRFNFGFPEDIYEEPGFYTGLFRVTDPVQNRTLMGVARVNLVAKSVDFYTLGPSQSIGSFGLAPDKSKAYALRQQVGNYEFWTFDLENRRVSQRTPFEGRPRMSLTPSSNGRYLYIHGAGSTIDFYDAQTFEKVRTVDLGADMTEFVLLPPRPTGGR
ncbi:MAG: YncE family protein [Longimicrobiales bacterium]